MAQSVRPIDLDLARHHASLTRLARRLVVDVNVADDLVQETYRVALERPPRDDRRLGGWLARVLRTRWIDRVTADSRRRAREHEAAALTPASNLGAGEVLAAQRELLDAVAALPEELLTVVHLRYFEDLGPREIAARVGAPVPTVKSRLSRARRTLRETLERRGARGGRSLHTILLPLLRGPAPGVLNTATGVLAVSAPVAKVALCAVVVGASLWIAWPEPPRPAAPDVAAPATEAEAARAPVERPTPRAPASSRAASAGETGPSPEVAAVTPAAVAPVTFVGIVVDADDRAVAGVRVGFRGRPDGVSATTAPDGTFRLQTSRPPSALVVHDEGWVTVGAGAPPLSRTEVDTVVVVARPRRIAGVVVDPAGLPVPSAIVEVGLPADFRRRFDRPLDDTLDEVAATRTGSDGRFDLRAPRITGATLAARREGFTPHAEVLGGDALVERRVVLGALAAVAEAVRGVVVDPDGRPVADARVSFGAAVTRSDAVGRFELACAGDDDLLRRFDDRIETGARAITALKPGFLPGRHEVALGPDGAASWPNEVVLRLGAAPLAIAGRVLDAAGEPVDGALVWVDDLSLFSVDGDQCVESAIGDGDARSRTVMTRTDAAGSFRIPGLLDQAYRVAATDGRSFVTDRTGPVAAGRADVTLVLDAAEEAWREVSGVVVDADGRPRAGLGVALMLDVCRIRYGDEFVRSSSLLAREVRTGADGGFSLSDVARRDAYLFVSGPGVEGTRFDLDAHAAADGDALTDLRLVIGRRYHVKVTLTNPADGDEVRFLDRGGAPVTVLTLRGKPSGPAKGRASLTDGESEVLSVGEGAVTAVLLRGGEEVRRGEVTPVAGQVTRVSL